MRWRRRIAFGLAALVALMLIAGAALWWIKPWVPDVVLASPGTTGERIDERGLFANYFPAGDKRGPAVLLLGGSQGGIGADVTRRAIDLQSKGFSVLSPSYFRAPGQPASLELIPLETFDAALDWLRSRPEVEPKRIAVVGHSKGAEAALLVGVRHPELRAVVAGAGSNVVWDGIDWSYPINPDSSWTSDGEALPSLPYALFRPWRHVGRAYEDGLGNAARRREAEIPIERVKASVLLVCGEADTLWPACEMSRSVRSRAAARGGPRVTVLAYERAGHSAFGPRLPDGHPDLSDRWSGGTATANNDARAKSWPLVVDFLRAALK
jgi:uncharacterized protein